MTGFGLLVSEAAALASRAETTDGDAWAAWWRSGSALAEPAEAGFVDRRTEAEVVQRGLRSPTGPHFWLMVAPPGLGKTEFLKFVARLMAEGPGWEIRSKDVRGLGEPFVSEPALLVASFFGQELDGSAGPDLAGRVARAILADGRSYLCLLDSAEMLTEQVIAEFRRHFSDIYQLTRGSAGDASAGRLALVVASRLDAGWRGVAPAPGFRALPVTAFTKDDVGEAVRNLAVEPAQDLGTWDRERAIARLCSFSAGVPELLTSGLRWLEGTGWRQVGLLDDEGLFQELGHPFVRDRLLSADSLLPLSSPERASKCRQLVEDALRLVAPYRIFTQSHLRQHLTPGSGLSQALDAVGWSLEDLWNAIAGSALLDRPLDELWQAVQPTVRGLLFRYFYPTGELRALAQRRALAFDRIWSQRQAGTEQVAGLAECLWHEASALRLSEPDQLETRLTESARALAGTLKQRGHYSVHDLRTLFGQRLHTDADLWELTSVAVGLLDRMIRIVTAV